MGWLLAPLYDHILAQTEARGLADWRRALLEELSGDVLEIGAGTGLNLAHYGPDVRLTLCEPDPGMRRQLQRRADGVGTVLDAPAEALPFADGSFDHVVATLVLCTVRDPDAAVAEVARVLRPGGQFVFLEHVAAAEGSARYRWQRLADPVWCRCAGGCHLTRRTAETIGRHLRIETIAEASMRGAPGIARPTIRGVAVRG